MKQIIILWMLLMANTSVAQKHDYIWLPGRGKIGDWPFSGVNYKGGGVIVDFNNYPPSLKLQNFPLNMYPQAVISNKKGDLVAYTNGCHIANKNHEIMANGDTINPGLYQGTTQCLFYYPTYQGTVFLPDPGNENRYYLFHMALDYAGNPFLSGQRYYYSLIDASANGGLGKVVDKNHLLLDNKSVGRYVTAVKHANGRDWWVVSPHHFANIYYNFLLTPNGVKVGWAQTIGDSLHNPCCGMTLFSPDGRKYFRGTSPSGLQILDFDRCTGRFSNPIFIHADSIGRTGPSGLAVSNDNRFLYVSTNAYVFQYDLQAPDITATKTLVAEYDPTYLDPELGTFNDARLAPDGKIYMVSLNYVPTMPVIHHPERAGAACRVEQRGFQLPALYGNDFIFNFPHYRLGPLDGSPCDTLGLDNIPLANFRWEAEDTLSPLRISFTEVCSYETKTWHWSFGDGTTGAERHPVHDYARPGKYEVCPTAENANGSDKFCRTLFLGVVPAENPELERGIEALPNPFSETFALILNLDLPNSRLLLRDQYGRVCRQTALSLGFNEVDTATLPPGFYYWEVWSRGERVKAGKVIKG